MIRPILIMFPVCFPTTPLLDNSYLKIMVLKQRWKENDYVGKGDVLDRKGK